MTTYIALFRGLNVGRRNILSMLSLRSILNSLGFSMVETYIRSGNAVFRTIEEDPSDLATAIQARIEEVHDFCPHVFIFTYDQLNEIMTNNPFPEATINPGRLNLSFLAEKPEHPDYGKIASAQDETEKAELIDSVFYLYAPDGMRRSKLAGNIEKILGVPLTSRSWRIIQKLNAMARRHKLMV